MSWQLIRSGGKFDLKMIDIANFALYNVYMLICCTFCIVLVSLDDLFFYITVDLCTPSKVRAKSVM